MAKGQGKVLAQNKKASHDYFIEETYEAGMALTGTEIKSVRAARVQLKDSYIRISRGEAWVINMHISPFEQGNRFNHDPLRERKLLLHKKQILDLNMAVKRDGYTLVPLKIYIKDGYAKLLLGVAKGKKDHDKRDDLRKKEAKREMDRAFKAKNQM
jgi:SsrA-binding protein